MDKEYLAINGELVMTDGKLIPVEDSANITDVVDEQTTYVAQSQSLTNEIEELLVNGVIDGSPKGVYANLSALQTAYPNGASGVYLTFDTGHWYYYNKGWQDGGAYRESFDTMYTKFDTVTAIDGATVSGTPKFLRYGKLYALTETLNITGSWTLGGGYSGWTEPVAVATISGGNEALTSEEITLLNGRLVAEGSGILAKQAYIQNGTIYIRVLQAAGGTNTITRVYLCALDWNTIDYPNLAKYPVGSIYMSTDYTSPAAMYGGVWASINGRFLLGAGNGYSVGDSDGEAMHTLTVEEMPSHRHSSDSYQVGYPNNVVDKEVFATWVNKGQQDNNNPNTGQDGPVRTSYVGGGQPHNNMPPYEVVYIWKRTA